MGRVHSCDILTGLEFPQKCAEVLQVKTQDLFGRKQYPHCLKHNDLLSSL
jgi:hypothetical protein